MHKLIIFLLIGSLVMLLPFGTSINIISKTMAFNIVPSMNNDKDYLQRYEKFYKDDSFREAYYNYHKQHHQHQQQIEKEVQQSIGHELQQNSMTESLSQQSTSQQQDRSSIISQEQMHQQQIEKLKQLLAAVR